MLGLMRGRPGATRIFALTHSGWDGQRGQRLTGYLLTGNRNDQRLALP
jgi:hypothetical protein